MADMAGLALFKRVALVVLVIFLLLYLVRRKR
jgi:hypothetical protein